MAMSASRRDSENERGTGTSWTERRGSASVRAPSRGARKATPNPSGAPIRTAPDTSSSSPADVGARRDHVGLHALGEAEKALTRLRQLATRRHAAKEPRAERLLERGNAPRHGGVVEAQAPRGAEDLAGARHGQEDAHVVPVHPRAPLTERLRNIMPEMLRA